MEQYGKLYHGFRAFQVHNVKNMEETITDKTVIVNYVPILVGGVAGGVLLLAGAAVLVLFLLKKKRNA